MVSVLAQTSQGVLSQSAQGVLSQSARETFGQSSQGVLGPPSQVVLAPPSQGVLAQQPQGVPQLGVLKNTPICASDTHERTQSELLNKVDVLIDNQMIMNEKLDAIIDVLKNSNSLLQDIVRKAQ